MKLSAARAISTASKKGFTLIELLVVIGILGILAAALVATIDPFEQLQKATDSRRKNMTVEFLNANIRYFTTHSAFPWSDNDNSDVADPHYNCFNTYGPGNPAPQIDGITLDATDMLNCVDAMVEDGELKDSFDTNLNDLENVYVTWDNSVDPNEVVVCYEPVSRSQKSSPETIYDANGNDISAGGTGPCPDPDAAPGTCFWCTR